MPTQQFVLSVLAPGPTGRAPQVRRARRYLEATHASVSGLIDSFNVVHERKVGERQNAQGRLGRDEVDLLRAALVFTSSGLDAACHALVADCVPLLVERPGSTAAKRFDIFLDEQIAQGAQPFGEAIKSPEPRGALVQLYVDMKTRASYQGTSDVKDRVRDLLGVPNSSVPAKRIEALAGFFTARNDIVHRLDYVAPSSSSTARHVRSPGDVVQECDLVLSLIADLIGGAATVLQAK